MGENTDAVLRAHREKEKREGRDSALRSAASHSHLKSSDSAGSSGSNSTVDPRAQIRSQSDDTAPRHLASSRSLDPTQARSPQRDRQDSQGSLNVPAYNSSASSVYLSASQTSVLHNVPPSNPSSLSTNERTVEPPKSPSITSSLTQDSFATSVPPRTTSLSTSVSSAPAPSSSGAGADTFSAGKPAAQYEMTDNVFGARQPAYNPRNVVRPPPSSQQDMGPVADTNVNGLKSANVTSPPHVPPSPSSRVPPEELQANTDAQPPLAWPLAITVNGDATLSPRPSAVSRDSRISLPEEAKRYYATMTDSPAASPALRSGFGQPGSPLKRESPTAPQTPPPQTQPRTSEESVGLGLATTETAGGTVTGRGWSSGRGPTADKAGSVATEEGAEFLDMDDEDSAYDSGANGSGRISSTLEDTDMTTLEEDPYAGVEDHSMRSEQSKSSRDVVEDFPLPPSTTSSAGYAPVPVASIRAQSQPSTVTQSQVEVGRTSVSSSDLPAQSSQPPFPLSQPQTQSSQLQIQSQSAEPVTPTSPFPLPLPANTPQMKFRALPLLAEDLPHTTVVVSHSSIRPNDRGKEVLSFIVSVEPGRGKEGWKVEKLYSDVLGLDARVRGAMGRNVGKKLMSLPEGRMWRDHAPAKVDQRKNALEQYFKSLIALPIKNKDEVIAFFTCDINFGGWKSRYFVLNGPTLEYYESRGGTHLGSITVTGAQIGRQQRTAGSITTTSARREPDEDNEYRHAFLIIEAKKGPSGSNARHVLCAETDRERDSWVEELVRYVTGSYTEDQIAVISNGPSPISVNSSLQNAPAQLVRA
ncbi:GTPase-activating protein BEM3 [Grifola frondosa]|uniref:GTPase-activating protein BEM3 n=1 Tax=Grifola frondosa TaxID=5627 RepID=A0A1C7LP60_GRIFR|nr:GTPase-activating protein BEM3 [Grifola frondosa]